MNRIITAIRTFLLVLTKHTVVEGAIIIEAKEQFGHLSHAVEEANTLDEVAVALRALAHANAISSPAITNQALAFLRGHRLRGRHSQAKLTV